MYKKTFCSTQSGHGIYTTPIDFYLIKKKGSLHLSGIRFCDFSYIFYQYTHTKTGLDSVVLKNVYTSGLRGQYDPTLKWMGNEKKNSIYFLHVSKEKKQIRHKSETFYTEMKA